MKRGDGVVAAETESVDQRCSESLDPMKSVAGRPPVAGTDAGSPMQNMKE